MAKVHRKWRNITQRGWCFFPFASGPPLHEGENPFLLRSSHFTCCSNRSVFLPPQVDVLDGLGRGPEGEQARQNRAGLDGRLQQKCVPEQQNGAVAQRSESGHLSGHPVLGGRLLWSHRDGVPQQLWAQGQHWFTIIRTLSLLKLREKGSQQHRRGIMLVWSLLMLWA